jgi:anti-anti-sigma regulatory factor
LPVPLAVRTVLEIAPMPGCIVEREVVEGTAWYRISGRFEGACACDLAGRLERETMVEVMLDFSQVATFSDCGIAVVASAFQSLKQKSIGLRGLRQHQERVFRCFGVDPAARHRSALPALSPGPQAPDKVA